METRRAVLNKKQLLPWPATSGSWAQKMATAAVARTRPLRGCCSAVYAGPSFRHPTGTPSLGLFCPPLRLTSIHRERVETVFSQCACRPRPSRSCQGNAKPRPPSLASHSPSQPLPAQSLLTCTHWSTMSSAGRSPFGAKATSVLSRRSPANANAHGTT